MWIFIYTLYMCVYTCIYIFISDPFIIGYGKILHIVSCSMNRSFLSILYIVVCIYYYQISNLSLLISFLFGSHYLFSMSVSLFLGCK